MADIKIKQAAKKVAKMRHNLGKGRPKPKETSGEVKRIEGNIAYVRFDGSEIDTPVNISHACEVGERIRVKVGDDRHAWTMGNITSPPTDNKVANFARRVADRASDTAIQAEERAIEAEHNSESAMASAESAVGYSIEARKLAGNTNQYFWHKEQADPTIEDDETGVHITEVPQEEWEDPNSENYHSGGNLLARSNGMAIRLGLIEFVQVLIDGLHLKGRMLSGGGYSFADLLAQAFRIGFHNTDLQDDVISEYFGYEGFNNFMYSRREIDNDIGLLSYYQSNKVDDEGFKIIHDRGYKPDSGQTNYIETTYLEDSELKIGSADENGNELGVIQEQAPVNQDDVIFGAKSPNKTQLVEVKYNEESDTADITTNGTYRGPLESPTVSITATTGTFVSASAKRSGQTVQLRVSYRNANNVEGGKNVFVGTLNTTALRPTFNTTGGSYFGTHPLMGGISPDGVITIRNASPKTEAIKIDGDNTGTISFTYLVE